jgi:riboflavin kinase/FMN adenylyltransferase
MKYLVPVIRGRGEGKRIGIPTLNFEIPAGFPEKEGIYAGWVWIGGEPHPAAFHYGPVPTFDVEASSLEAHLIDAGVAEAPAAAEFELVNFLREVRDFDDIAALQAQIAEDVRQAKTVLGIAL